MKNVHIFQVVSKVRSFVGTKYSKREADQRPDMHGTVAGAVVMTEIMYLGMAVVATGNAIICAGFYDLVIFNLAVSAPFFSET